MDFKIRGIEKSDLPQIVECLQVLTKVEWPADVELAFEELEQIGNSYIYVAELKEKIIGTASLIIQPKLIRGGCLCGYIEDVAVLREFQGKKVGQALIEVLIKLAASMNCYKVILNCAEHNIPFYTKLGFKRHDVGMRLDLIHG